MELTADRMGAWLAIATLTVGLAAGVVKWFILPNLFILLDKRLKPIETALLEAHHQLTVNHHSSVNPTVLDMLSDLRQGQRDMRDDVQSYKSRLDDHLSWSNLEVLKIWDAIRDDDGKGTE